MRCRRCIFAGIWIFSLVGISFYGGAISYGFFFLLTLVPVISGVYLLAVYFGFRIYQEVDSRDMVCNEPMSYYYVLENGSFFGFSSVSVRLFSGLSFVEDIPDYAEYELLPGDRQTFHTKLICRYKGEYEVGVKEVVITDFFRLFSFKYRIPSTIKAIVHPRTIPVSELAALSDVTAVVQKEARTGQNEPDVVVRDYVQGDCLRRIHWQASAREQKLKTRLQTGEEKQGILIICDRKRYSKDIYQYLPLENQLVETTLAISFFLAGKGIGYQVYTGWKQQGHYTVEGMNAYEGLYSYMSTMTFDEESNMWLSVEDAAGSGFLGDCRLVILVCHEVEEELLTRIQDLADKGMMVVVYYVTDEAGEKVLRQASERIRIVKITTADRLEGVL